MSTVIKVENVSKQYRLGLVGTGTMRDDLEGWWYRMRGKDDPNLKLGETNDRTSSSESNYVWALRDVNFEVNQGEVLGIIGKNGAGKSTLLKLLSRVTAPTIGNIKVKGRIASLLEVGTGFHPELTGKENIFLNGAIMGMKKHEIARKLDEIVDFAGVERYLETPVKRYSSGMYVRLAFAVAAHLEPEILIVDEVLAVGDAEFQKKALGKMKEVSSGAGRTVLFVSHNMEAVKSLCTKALLLHNGKIATVGTPNLVIEKYLSTSSKNKLASHWSMEEAPGNDQVRILRAELLQPHGERRNFITVKSNICIEYEFWLENELMITNLSIQLYSGLDVCIFAALSQLPAPPLHRGLHKGVCKIPANLLNTGLYSITMMIVKDTSTPVFIHSDVISFEVVEEREAMHWHGNFPGFIRPNLSFQLS
jgi:lipopolysaccharide transport system ATP-binding protein